MNFTTLHIKIHGRVQGISFRSSAKRQADKLGVKGWVKNIEDGTVEAEAQGSKETLKKFVEWCHRGPMFARVDELEVTELSESKQYKTFDIIRK